MTLAGVDPGLAEEVQDGLFGYMARVLEPRETD